MYQPFIFTEASLSDLADDDTRAGAITIELWHVEIVSQTNPTAWNSLGYINTNQVNKLMLLHQIFRILLLSVLPLKMSELGPML